MTNHLTHRLNLLADNVDPAPIDTYDVIAKAQLRRKSRRAAVAAALAVVGAIVATIGFTGATRPSPPADKTTTSTKAEKYFDDRSRRFTEKLTRAWPSIAPPGVEALPSPSGKTVYERDTAPLEFGEMPMGDKKSNWYRAFAVLSSAEGTSEFVVHVWAPGDGMVVQGFCDPARGCQALSAPDGSEGEYNLRVVSGTSLGNDLTVWRPDGTVVAVWESPFTSTNPQGKPPLHLTKDDMMAIAVLFTY